MKTLRLAALAALLAFVLAPLPAQANTKRTYAKVTQTNPGASTLQMSTVELLRFLVEGTTVGGGAATGPGWTLVEAYSDGVRCMPSDASDVDSLETESAGPVPSGTPGCAGMRGDGSGLSTGDWFVVESADSTGGGGTNHFQVLIEYNSTITWNFVMMPLEDWQLGTAVPDTPGTETRVGAGAGKLTFETHSGADTLDIIADEDVMIIRRDDVTTVGWLYVGAVNGNMTTSTPPDDRPFVINDMPELVSFSVTNTGVVWDRLAPDDAAILTAGEAFHLEAYSHGLNDMAATYNGAYQLAPVLIGFWDASHQHVAGYLQYVRTTSDAIGMAAKSLGNLTWACRNNLATHCPICLAWDGATSYP